MHLHHILHVALPVPGALVLLIFITSKAAALALVMIVCMKHTVLCITSEAAAFSQNSKRANMLHLQTRRLLDAQAQALVMVGDPKQLPPTVKCREAERLGLGLSMFDRLQAMGLAPLLLDVQYRMHPALCQFPSAQFYGGLLRSWPQPQERPLPGGVAWPNPEVCDYEGSTCVRGGLRLLLPGVSTTARHRGVCMLSSGQCMAAELLPNTTAQARGGMNRRPLVPYEASAAGAGHVHPVQRPREPHPSQHGPEQAARGSRICRQQRRSCWAQQQQQQQCCWGWQWRIQLLQQRRGRCCCWVLGAAAAAGRAGIC